MNEITLILTDCERTRLWLALIDDAEEAAREVAAARTDEGRERCVADVDLLLRVAEVIGGGAA